MADDKIAAVRRLATNSMSNLLAQASSMVARLVVTMLVARYLGKALFGDRSYVMALVGSFEILANFGLNQIAVREIAIRRDKAEVYFGSVLVLKGFMTLLTLSILIVIAQTSPGAPHVRAGIYLYGIAAVLNFLANTFFVLYRAFERMQYEALLVSVERGLFLLAVIALVYGQAGFVALFWANLIAAVAKLIVGTYITATRFTLPRIQFNWALYIDYMRETLPVGISQMINTLSVRIDIVLLGYLTASETVGTFAGPYRIVDAVGLISIVLVTTVFPVMARHASASMDALRQLLQRSVKITLLVAIPSSISLAILARPALNLALGEQFVDSKGVLQVLTAVIVPIFLNRLFHFAFISIKRQTEYTFISGSALLLNIAIDLVLIPRIGYWGACIGAVSSAFVCLLLCSWRLKRQVGSVYSWNSLRHIIVPNLALTAILLMLHSWSWIAAAVTGAAVYLILIWFMGALDHEERGTLCLAVGKIGYRPR